MCFDILCLTVPVENRISLKKNGEVHDQVIVLLGLDTIKKRPLTFLMWFYDKYLLVSGENLVQKRHMTNKKLF